MIIYHKFTSLNKYINSERTNKFVAAKIKREETRIAYLSLKGSPAIKTPCKLRFIWATTNKRIDPDNIAWAKKFILDGMVKANIIPDDTRKHITGFVDDFLIGDKDSVRIEVI